MALALLALIAMALPVRPCAAIGDRGRARRDEEVTGEAVLDLLHLSLAAEPLHVSGEDDLHRFRASPADADGAADPALEAARWPRHRSSAAFRPPGSRRSPYASRSSGSRSRIWSYRSPSTLRSRSRSRSSRAVPSRARDRCSARTC